MNLSFLMPGALILHMGWICLGTTIFLFAFVVVVILKSVAVLLQSPPGINLSCIPVFPLLTFAP